MSISEQINQIHSFVHELRSQQKESEIKSNDPLLANNIKNINQKIDSLQSQIFKQTRNGRLSTNDICKKNNDSYGLKSFSYYVKGLNGATDTVTYESEDQNAPHRQNANSESTSKPSESDLESGERLAENQPYGPGSIVDYVNEKLAQKCFMRKISSYCLIKSEIMDLPDEDPSALAVWSGNESFASVPNGFGAKQIRTHALTAQPAVAQKTIDDFCGDIGIHVADKLSDFFCAKEESAFLSGDGVNKPKGVLSYPTADIARITSSTAKSFLANDIMKLVSSIPSLFSNNISFVMHRSTMHKIRSLSDPATGQFLWSSSLLSTSPNSILGYPVFLTDAMNGTDATGSDVVVCGNFEKGYQVVDRDNLVVQRDPYSKKPFVTFFATKRVGGDVINKSAFSVLRLK